MSWPEPDAMFAKRSPPKPAADLAKAEMPAPARSAASGPPAGRDRASASLAQAVVQAEAEDALAMSEAAAMPSPPPASAIRLAAAPAWYPAIFQGLPLAGATREQVRARFGAPVSEPSGTADRYAELPGEGRVGFRYDAQSRLVEVIAEIQPPQALSDWLAHHGWSESAYTGAATWICGGERIDAAAGGDSVRLYPARGTWLLLDAEHRVRQAHYRSACEVP
jgi:hypothetical protein